MPRCQVCHRELKNPAHVAAGIGPKCQAKAARFGIAGGQAKTTEEVAWAQKLAKTEALIAYYSANLTAVERNLRLLCLEPNYDQALAARGQWVCGLLRRGLTRLDRIRDSIQGQAATLAAGAHRSHHRSHQRDARMDGKQMRAAEREQEIAALRAELRDAIARFDAVELVVTLGRMVGASDQRVTDERIHAAAAREVARLISILAELEAAPKTAA